MVQKRNINIALNSFGGMSLRAHLVDTRIINVKSTSIIVLGSKSCIWFLLSPLRCLPMLSSNGSATSVVCGFSLAPVLICTTSGPIKRFSVNLIYNGLKDCLFRLTHTQVNLKTRSSKLNFNLICYNVQLCFLC